jgi:hypothetical protein
MGLRTIDVTLMHQIRAARVTFYCSSRVWKWRGIVLGGC